MRKKAFFIVSMIILVVLLGSYKKEKSVLLADSIDNRYDNQAIHTTVNLESFIEDNKTNIDRIKTKSFYKKEDDYVIDYKYPYLDTSFNSSFKVFNDFLSKKYLSEDISVRGTLNEHQLECNVGYHSSERHKRLIDYKVYSNEDIISILIYKGNHYKNDQYSYMFQTLNFDTIHGKFISYKDIFRDNSKLDVLKVINHTLKGQINSESAYEECWELTVDTFSKYKNNFVMNNEAIKFYFDD